MDKWKEGVKIEGNEREKHSATLTRPASYFISPILGGMIKTYQTLDYSAAASAVDAGRSLGATLLILCLDPIYVDLPQSGV